MVRLFGWTAVTVCLALAAVAPQDSNGDSRQPTGLETMLVGYICDLPTSSDPIDDGARERCTEAQRQALRAEFGYDLSRLSTAERGKLDAACSHLRTKVELEPYLKCLARGLASIRPRWTPEKLRQPSLDPQTVVSPMASTAPFTPRRSWPSIPLLAGAVLAAVAVAGTVLMKRRRRSGHVCRDCGAAAEGHGHLCPDCRHRRAAAMKQTNIDRAEQERAEHEALQRRQAEDEERERQALDARRRQDEAARQAAEALARPRPQIILSAPDDDGLS
jgi:hypothetical protein